MEDQFEMQMTMQIFECFKLIKWYGNSCISPVTFFVSFLLYLSLFHLSIKNNSTWNSIFTTGKSPPVKRLSVFVICMEHLISSVSPLLYSTWSKSRDVAQRCHHHRLNAWTRFKSLFLMHAPAHEWLETKRIQHLIGWKSATWTSSSNR